MRRDETAICRLCAGVRGLLVDGSFGRSLGRDARLHVVRPVRGADVSCARTPNTSDGRLDVDSE